MTKTYLTVPFTEKDAAKALGARWDAAQKQWFVPPGRELTPFAVWLPAGPDLASPPALVNAPAPGLGSALAAAPAKAVSLSSLLAGVSQAVAQTYKAGVWTLVEVVELRANGGHVFMGVSERDAQGAVLAKTSAVIWQSVAASILPAFEQATGVQLAAGIKLLVRARPVFKTLHGFSLEVDAIDPEYTLGDLEARKREIRERLQAEGVFTANQQLPFPWDFNAVLVLAPEGGAGLGDFQVEAQRLETFGLCRFVYAYSRFQGEGAARDIADALQAALQHWPATAAVPDAIVIIRGGATNDLAWLNQYDLARLICDLNVPVLTGIGHERDSTVLDEVANTRYDTPSKVIAGIQHTIVKRSAEAQQNFEHIVFRSHGTVASARSAVQANEASVRLEARQQLAHARAATTGHMADIRLDAVDSLRSAAEATRTTLQRIESAAAVQLAQAKQEVPAYLQQIEQGARQALRQAAQQSEALLREITGQGPDKTLRRGFALVRNDQGQAVTRAAQANTGARLTLQFSDGTLQAHADPTTLTLTPLTPSKKTKKAHA